MPVALSKLCFPMRLFLLLLVSILLFTQCSVFQQSYSYNDSRSERGDEREPERRERPLYEPLEEEEAVAEEEVEFEEGPTPPSRPEINPDLEGEDEEAVLRLEVVEHAKAYLGTKYRLGGTDPKSGFDCSGFTSYVMDKAGLEISRTSQSQAKEGKKVKLKRVKPGDLIFYRRSPLGSVFHVSLVVDNKKDGVYVIHSTSRGVVIDNITRSSYWEPKISSARDVISQ